jgi:hypothetical protein
MLDDDIDGLDPSQAIQTVQPLVPWEKKPTSALFSVVILGAQYIRLYCC